MVYRNLSFSYFFRERDNIFKILSLIEHVERMWKLRAKFPTPRVCRLSATAINELVGVFDIHYYYYYD